MNSQIKGLKHDSNGPFVCRHRPAAVFRGRSRTVIDDSGLLTAWNCADCGGLIEEVRMLSRDGMPERRPVRYVVGPRQRMDHHAAVSTRY